MCTGRKSGPTRVRMEAWRSGFSKGRWVKAVRLLTPSGLLMEARSRRSWSISGCRRLVHRWRKRGGVARLPKVALRLRLSVIRWVTRGTDARQWTAFGRRRCNERSLRVCTTDCPSFEYRRDAGVELGGGSAGLFGGPLRQGRRLRARRGVPPEQVRQYRTRRHHAKGHDVHDGVPGRNGRLWFQSLRLHVGAVRAEAVCAPARGESALRPQVRSAIFQS
jgi:hypothetical protein